MTLGDAPTMSLPALVVAMAFATGAPALAAGDHDGGHDDDAGHHGANIGEPGEAAAASRTVTVTMADYAYEPESIEVRQGQTVRFVVENEGSVVHEFNIGTAEMHAAHRDEMRMMVEHGVIEGDKLDRAKMNADMGGGQTMTHDDPNSLLLEPGRTGEIVWTFSTDADLEFACNIPGHYEAGMVGELETIAGDGASD